MNMNKIISIGVVLIGLSLIFINANNSLGLMSNNSLGGMQAATISSIASKDGCGVSNRKYSLLSIAHHVGSPELFTNFTDCPTKIAVRSGDWNDQGTWGGGIPSQDDIVLIPKNTAITLSNSARVKTAGVAGSLVFNDRSNINFEVENFQTYSGGSLTITPSDNVVHKIIFTGNVEISRDPAQYGLGLVAIDSNVKIKGRSTRATNSKIISANAGSNSITVADDVSDWRVGQNIILADTEKVGDQYVPHTEIKRISSINGSTINLDSSLSNTYKSSVVYAGQNIIFTSNAPVSGHIMFTGNTKLDFSGVYIEKMGRTRSAPVASVNFSQDGEVLGLPDNQIGRYSLHAHHLEQPYYISGNVINNTGDSMLRWSATLHASYGSFTNNSIVNPGESGIGIETYVDTGDVSNNLVIGSGGGAEYGQAFQSFGIWSRSPFSNINNNRIEGWVKSYAYFIDPDGSQFYVGQTFPHVEGSPKSGATVHNQEIPGTFNGNINTAYVGFPKGNEFRRASALWLGHFFGSTYTVDDFKSTRGGIFAYYSRNFTFNNIKLNNSEENSNSAQYGYLAVGVLMASFTNTEITGFQAGYVPASISEFRNGRLDNKIDVVSMIGDQDCYCHADSPGENIVLDSVQFSPTGMHVVMVPKFAYAFELFRKISNPSEISSDIETILKTGPEYILRMLNPNSRIILKNYNLQGQNYIVYPTYQTPDFIVPTFGVSNQDLYDGKGTISYSAGMYGRSLGDYIVRNPIYNPKIFGLVESIKPPRVLASADDFQPLAASPSYNLRYYTNSPGTKVNFSNFLIDYGGDEHVISNFKGFRGLNKIQVKINNNPYTLLFYGPDGLPVGTQPTDEQVVTDTPKVPDAPKPAEVPANNPLNNPLNPITNPPTNPAGSISNLPGIGSLKPLTPANPSNSKITIWTDSNKTTFGLGNVAFYSNGPVGVYRWSIVDSKGVLKTQSNGNVIQTMYYNFTSPGVYNVSLAILDGKGDLVGISNTITVNIVSKATVLDPLTPIAVSVAPHISILNPSLVSFGDNVKLTGTGFVGVGVINVNIKNTNGIVVVNPTIKSATASEINFTAPNITPGNYYVTVLNSNGESNITILTIQGVAQSLPPRIESVQPSNYVKSGDTVTLLGTRFSGVDAGRVYLRINNGIKIPVIFITSSLNKVVFNMPDISPGTYSVTVIGDSGTSNSVDLIVNTNTPLDIKTTSPVAPLVGATTNTVPVATSPSPEPTTPRIDSILPSNSVKVGDTITLVGARFSGVDAGKVFLGIGNLEKIPVIFITSDENRVVFNVPNVTPGTYRVTVLNNSGLSNAMDLVIGSGNTNSASVLSGLLDKFFGLFVKN